MLLFFAMLSSSCAQKSTTGDPAFDSKLNELLTFSIPTINATELNDKKGIVQLFDAREESEYNTSHIPGAIHVGFENFDSTRFKGIKKEAPIVLYCSIGYRQKLKNGQTSLFVAQGPSIGESKKSILI